MILSYEVPFDGRWHPIELRGPVLYVAALAGNRVIIKFWALHHDHGTKVPWEMKVFHTGQSLGEAIATGATYVGTALTTGEPGWEPPQECHLFQRASKEAQNE